MKTVISVINCIFLWPESLINVNCASSMGVSVWGCKYINYWLSGYPELCLFEGFGTWLQVLKMAERSWTLLVKRLVSLPRVMAAVLLFPNNNNYCMSFRGSVWIYFCIEILEILPLITAHCRSSDASLNSNCLMNLNK